jgi:hypothetical protein
MSDEVNATSAGAEWAMYDVELAKKYPNKWVVAIPNEIVAMGDDPDEVRRLAAERLGLPACDVVLTNIAALETRVPIRW